MAGVSVSNVDMGDLEAVRAAIIPGKTKLVMVESPTNPRMQVRRGAAPHSTPAPPPCSGGRPPCLGYTHSHVSRSCSAPAWSQEQLCLRACPLHSHTAATWNHCFPSLQICDIAAISEMAHAVGALVCVDNTIMSPTFQVRVSELDRG